jgi:hypothetical protein
METNFKILTGKKSINDWFSFYLIICNHFDFEFSILGYGISLNIVLKDSIKEGSL